VHKSRGPEGSYKEGTHFWVKDKERWGVCGGGIGFDWPFDFAQGRAEIEFWAGIGFELALFWITFVDHCSLFVGISLWCCYTYVYIAHFEIGFVLQKNRAICRGVSTSVEGRQAGQDGRVGQKTGDRRQERDSR